MDKYAPVVFMNSADTHTQMFTWRTSSRTSGSSSESSPTCRCSSSPNTLESSESEQVTTELSSLGPHFLARRTSQCRTDPAPGAPVRGEHAGDSSAPPRHRVLSRQSGMRFSVEGDAVACRNPPRLGGSFSATEVAPGETAVRRGAVVRSGLRTTLPGDLPHVRVLELGPSGSWGASSVSRLMPYLLDCNMSSRPEDPGCN